MSLTEFEFLTYELVYGNSTPFPELDPIIRDWYNWWERKNNSVTYVASENSKLFFDLTPYLIKQGIPKKDLLDSIKFAIEYMFQSDFEPLWDMNEIKKKVWFKKYSKKFL